MKIKIIRIRQPYDADFYALQRPRFLRRSLWYSEAYSDGGDLIKFKTHQQASIAAVYSTLRIKQWLPCKLENFGYELVSETEEDFLC